MKKSRTVSASSRFVAGSHVTSARGACAISESRANLVPNVWWRWIAAWQRSVLFLDVMRECSQRYEALAAKTALQVLKFASDRIMCGRKLPRPVNYGLVRVQPPKGIEIDSVKQPVVVVGRRAGRGPGLGGFKPESDIGVALKSSHSCYFLGFLPVQKMSGLSSRRTSLFLWWPE